MDWSLIFECGKWEFVAQVNIHIIQIYIILIYYITNKYNISARVAQWIGRLPPNVVSGNSNPTVETRKVTDG